MAFRCAVGADAMAPMLTCRGFMTRALTLAVGGFVVAERVTGKTSTAETSMFAVGGS